jgi:hypothetical protein
MALTQVQGQMLTGSSNTTTTIQSNGTTAITINSSQNVGIGTASPNGKLDVAGTIMVSSTDGNSGGIISTSGEATLSNKLVLNGSRGSGGIVFQANSAEAMRIDSGGDVLIGCTANPSSSVAGVKWSNPALGAPRISTGSGTGTATAIAFFNGNGNVGAINTSGSNTAYATSSDYRLKDNIAPMTGALAKVSALKPCTYTWKADGANGEGFIAHELAEVAPQAVIGAKDEMDGEGNPKYQSIDTSFLVATLTAAIQEQQAIITDLKARIETLEAK